VGYVTGPSLLYVTGGAAFVQLEDKFGGCAPGFLCATSPPASLTTTKTGWAAGGGLETKLSRNWSQKTEYLFVDAGRSEFQSNQGNLPPASFKNQFHVIKTGINYAFGGPAEAFPLFNRTMLPTDHNWAGFYLGVNAGGGLTTSRLTSNAVDSDTSRGDNDFSGKGFAGGVQAGYNVMGLLRPNWFVGVEADIGYLGIKTSHTDWDDVVFMGQTTNWYSTVRGRIGTTTGPALLYATAGAAFVSVRDEFSSTVVELPTTNNAHYEVKTGWTLGGGTEVALDARWSAKLEYLYINSGKSRPSFSGVEGGAPFTVATDVTNRFHVIRAGLNYSLATPVIAKY
jgi:outer membrane immunogenic protein